MTRTLCILADSATGTPAPTTLLRPSDPAPILEALEQRRAVTVRFPRLCGLPADELTAVPVENGEARLTRSASGLQLSISQWRPFRANYAVLGPRTAGRWLVGRELASLLLKSYESGDLSRHFRRLELHRASLVGITAEDVQ